jgi:hypothetical protein
LKRGEGRRREGTVTISSDPGVDPLRAKPLGLPIDFKSALQDTVPGNLRNIYLGETPFPKKGERLFSLGKISVEALKSGKKTSKSSGEYGKKN